MDCKVGECIHNSNFTCRCNNKLNDPSKGFDCSGFDFDCSVCQEIGFQHYGCADCCLSEDEYYGDEEEDC